MRGEPGFQKWLRGEPNRPDTEHCVSVGYIVYNWIDVPCSKYFSYICQRELCLPTIESIEPQPCNSRLLVRWTPHANGVGYNHSITLLNEDESYNVIYYASPVSNETQQIIIENLASSTEYVIRISGCIHDYSYLNVANGSNITGGLPNLVVMPVLSENCTISWSWPNHTRRDMITGFQITIQSSLVYAWHLSSVPPVQNETINIPTSNLSYTISTLPNRNYSAKIQARTCAGNGPMAVAERVCITKAEAPSSLSLPAVSDNQNADGMKILTLRKPNEENGPISCILVIVGENSNFSLITRKNDLVRINSTRTNGENNQHIALSISYVTFRNASSSSFKVYLGDGSTTTCDATDAVKQRRRKRSIESLVFVGNNKLLQYDRVYRLYTVTTTVGDEILLQTSQPISFLTKTKETINEEKGNDSWLIPVIVIAVSLLLCLIAGGIFKFYKKKKSSAKNSSKNAPKSPMRSKSRKESQAPSKEHGNAVAYPYEEIVDVGIPKNTSILLLRFEEVFKTKASNNSYRFQKEFKAIPKEVSHYEQSTSCSSRPELQTKNRNQEIIPFDNSRVIIQQNESGYINASYVNGFDQDRKFIATQGPLPSTINDFWLMVVEQDCRVIVMLTKCAENGQDVCKKYWPATKKTKYFGSVSVNNVEERNCGDYIQRVFNVRSANQTYGHIKTVRQYQLKKWPDHVNSRATSSIVKMHQEVMKSQKMEPGNPPIIVHCSTGAGRSGTFIAYDILLDESKASCKVDAFQCVMDLRSQRMGAVETCDDYILLHNMILAHYLPEANEDDSKRRENEMYNDEGFQVGGYYEDIF